MKSDLIHHINVSLSQMDSDTLRAVLIALRRINMNKKPKKNITYFMSVFLPTYCATIIVPFRFCYKVVRKWITRKK